MSGATKTRIVIASVLKPVNDVRMAEKIGVSLSMLDGAEVHVIGFPATGAVAMGLHCHPLPRFRRLSFQRVLCSLRIMRMAISLKPALFIVTTHELLCISVLVKIFTRAKLIYDIQENYYMNIRYTDAFPVPLRRVLAVCVRISEHITSPFVDHFFLAESNYAGELPFLGRRFTILENKAMKAPMSNFIARDRRKLLFTGTLAESTGVFKAIELAIGLHKADSNVSLAIIGYCPRKNTMEKIRALAEDYPFISLKGGDELVPHDVIIREILAAGAGIISYPPNPSTSSSMPTKLYEYLACRLPICLIRHVAWEDRCKPYNAAVTFGWSMDDPERILNALISGRFYTAVPDDVFWDSEEKKLLPSVREMLRQS